MADSKPSRFSESFMDCIADEAVRKSMRITGGSCAYHFTQNAQDHLESLASLERLKREYIHVNPEYLDAAFKHMLF